MSRQDEELGTTPRLVPQIDVLLSLKVEKEMRGVDTATRVQGVSTGRQKAAKRQLMEQVQPGGSSLGRRGRGVQAPTWDWLCSVPGAVLCWFLGHWPGPTIWEQCPLPIQQRRTQDRKLVLGEREPLARHPHSLKLRGCWPRALPPTWSPGALLSPLLPCRRPISSGSLSDLTSTTNSLLRDGGSVLGGGREGSSWRLGAREGQGP